MFSENQMIFSLATVSAAPLRLDLVRARARLDLSPSPVPAVPASILHPCQAVLRRRVTTCRASFSSGFANTDFSTCCSPPLHRPGPCGNASAALVHTVRDELCSSHLISLHSAPSSAPRLPRTPPWLWAQHSSALEAAEGRVEKAGAGA